MVATPYNTSPNLGANFLDPEAQYFWDMIGDRVGVAAGAPSPQLGTKFCGSDGRDYLHVKATPAFAANARAAVNETTWAATADAAGAWQAVTAVPAGAYVWLRRFVI